jgi:hypothetical protein
MSDSSDIDAAVSATLLADATLMSYAPDGVYFDEGAPTAKHFIVCSLVTEFDAPVFNARSHEDVVYRVKVIDLNVSGLNAKRAAASIG